MSADVISQPAPDGKRAHAGFWTPRRAGVVIVAVLGVIVASLLAGAPERAATPERAPPRLTQSAPPAQTADFVTLDGAAAELTSTPPSRRPARRNQRSGVPLDASAGVEPAGYEILSAAELDGISQARE